MNRTRPHAAILRDFTPEEAADMAARAAALGPPTTIKAIPRPFSWKEAEEEAFAGEIATAAAETLGRAASLAAIAAHEQACIAAAAGPKAP